jgi:hypothetical protein
LSRVVRPFRDMLKTPSFLFAFWLCVIAIVGLSRVYDSAPPQAIGLTVAFGTLAILVLSRYSKTFSQEMGSISIERLICWHAIRAPIGAGFLVMSTEGLLPPLFANRAGYGDIFAAITGVLVVAFGASTMNQRAKSLTYIAWNILGLADLFLAVGTGISLAIQVPGSMIWIARMPLLVVPAFILPVLFATHAIMLKRLFGSLGKSKAVAD